MLKIIGVILFLVFAAVSLSIRFRLMESENSIKKDKGERRSILAKIIRNSLMMK